MGGVVVGKPFPFPRHHHVLRNVASLRRFVFRALVDCSKPSRGGVFDV